MIRLRWLILGVIALPFVEFAAFWWVAGRVGFFTALISVIATSMIGVMILKGGARLLFTQLAAGRVVLLNQGAARSGMLTALAGLLLAIPGFVTDLAAVALLLPALKALLFGTRALTPHGPSRTPPPPGVVDLDPGDWREETEPARSRRRTRRIDRD
ncbi:FxsA family protein [Phreatobacter stygius]|nr:FxsA family protein [Phreatobacter stygius]